MIIGTPKIWDIREGIEKGKYSPLMALIPFMQETTKEKQSFLKKETNVSK